MRSRLVTTLTPASTAYGEAVVLAAVLDGEVEGEWVGVDGVDVVLERRAGDTWEAFGSATTDSYGEAHVAGLVAERNQTYRVRYDGAHGGIADAFDAAEQTAEQTVLRSVGGRSKQAGKGKRRISGKVSPAEEAVVVTLQRRVGSGAWKRAATVRTDAAGRWEFVVPTKVKKTTRYRAMVKASERFAVSYGATVTIKSR